MPLPMRTMSATRISPGMARSLTGLPTRWTGTQAARSCTSPLPKAISRSRLGLTISSTILLTLQAVGAKVCTP